MKETRRQKSRATVPCFLVLKFTENDSAQSQIGIIEMLGRNRMRCKSSEASYKIYRLYRDEEVYKSGK